jgi:RNA polymerase sigma factor (sigma-70 family)
MAKPRRATNAHSPYQFSLTQQLDDRNAQRQALLDAALGGSAEAHGALLAHCRAIMLRYFKSRLARGLARKADEEDLVQDASLLAMDRFVQFRGATVAQYLSWLTSICRRVLCAFARSFRPGSDRDLGREQSLDEPCAQTCQQPLVGQSPTGEAMLEKREAAERLRAVLALLPIDERAIIALRHESGLTFIQIAIRLGRSVDSTKRCSYQTVACLRGWLANEPP